MVSWREIERIRTSGWRELVLRLLETDPDALSDWELDFLEGKLRPEIKELSLAQAEKLLEIRDKLAWVTEHEGQSISSLIRTCFEARLDLSEDDEEWIMALHAANPASIRRRQLARLIRCARELCPAG